MISADIVYLFNLIHVDDRFLWIPDILGCQIGKSIHQPRESLWIKEFPLHWAGKRIASVNPFIDALYFVETAFSTWFFQCSVTNYAKTTCIVIVCHACERHKYRKLSLTDNPWV